MIVIPHNRYSPEIEYLGVGLYLWSDEETLEMDLTGLASS